MDIIKDSAKVAEAEFELYWLIKLPDYLKEKQQELDNVYDHVQLPVMSPNESGFLTGNCPPTYTQALRIYGMRTGLEKSIERSVKRGHHIVSALNALGEEDKEKLLNYYSKGVKKSIDSILIKFWSLYNKERSQDRTKRAQDRARLIKSKYELIGV